MVEDISGWLRAVRPATAADEDWAASAQASEILAAIQLAVEADPQPESLSALNRTGRKFWVPVGAVAVAATVLAGIVVTDIALTSPPSPRSPVAASTQPSAAVKAQLPAVRPAARLLTDYSSCADLLGGLRSHTAASVGPYGLPSQQGTYLQNGLDRIPAPDFNSSSQKAAVASPDSGTSSTNVQEAGVDEPDIAKTDSGRLITITDGTLRVVDDASHKVTGSLDLTVYQGWQNAQLLVAAKQALVILSSGNNVGFDGVISPYSGAVGGVSPLSSYLFVDLAGQPKVTGSLRASGAYVDARKVGNTVRLVVGSRPNINLPAYAGSDAKSKAANQAAIAKAPISAWLPQYSITTGTGTAKYTAPCGAVSHPAAYTGASLLTVYTLDMTHLPAIAAPVTVAADGNTVYATGNSLFIASNPGWYCCAGQLAQRTEIHRFDISGSSNPTYLGSASIPGRLLSQYSLSDYAGSLRIAVTIGNPGSPGYFSSVYVLNADSLKTQGHVDHLGDDEQLYAVRFLGPQAYVVTFKQTDPLFVLDLHNPSAPKLAGTLQLTGFSDYLHDAGGSRLIGVGQEASKAGIVAGLQVSLFDVSNPAKPSRTGHVVRSDAPGESNFDPHTFLYWQPTGLVVIPTPMWASSQSGKVLVLQVKGSSLSTVGLLANPATSGTLQDGLGIQRSFVVDGQLWTISGSGVQITNPATLARVAWIAYS